MNLEDRVRRLERSNRVLVGSSVALLSTAALSLVVASAQDRREARAPDRVRCSGVEVVNTDGDVVVRLGIDEDGAAGLFVDDGQGRLRASVTHDADESALFLRDEHGDVRVGVAQFAHGGGGVALHGPGAKGAAVLYYKNRGSLRFFAEDGSTQLALPGDDQ